MGKTFHLLSTDPVTRRRLQQAHELRNAYLRVALTRLLRDCVPWLTRPRPNACPADSFANAESNARQSR
jgi:hypothetical protein